MLKLPKVAVTGGIASGKSSVIGFFQKYGAYIVSADQIVHQFLSSDTAIQKKIIALLGEEILENGCIDRKKVASVVFSDPKLLKKLEALIHPLVDKEIKRQWAEAERSQKYSLFVAEVPLLFEAEQADWYDKIIAVIRPEEACMKADDYKRRQKFQKTQAEKAQRANIIIENTGSLEELEAKVADAYKLLTQGEDLDV